MRPREPERDGELGGDDDVLGLDDVDAMGERGPVRLVLSSAAMPPTRVIPSQAAMYSGRFGISRHTASPLSRPCASAQRE